MYKIVCLLINYVKLAMLSELLVPVKKGIAECQRLIDISSSDMQKNFFGGKICAYKELVCMIERQIHKIKDGGEKDAR